MFFILSISVTSGYFFLRLSLSEVREYIRELLNLQYLRVLVSLVSTPKGEAIITSSVEVQLLASQCLLLLGQFLGDELYTMILSCTECLQSLSTFLGRRYEDGSDDHSRQIQASMRTLQMMVFACDSDRKFATMICRNSFLFGSIQKCEVSNDGRDLKTAVSGSWAGLSVSALAHVLMQKLREHNKHVIRES